MSTDLRTIINDCDATTGWSGDDSASVDNDTGSFYEGSAALSTQLSDSDEQMHTTQDSVGMGTFSLDWSDSTLYLLVKDNLGDTFANGGVQFVIGDGTNLVGYDVGGNDAGGLLLPTYFQSYKLDVSVVVATPGSFATYSGSEANLDQTAITQVGYGSLHLAKAVGSIDNVRMDAFRYIANGSYALRINGGTSGTPETMSDVQGDDVTNGWGMVSNPIGDQFWFFAPIEWGEPSANADHYFTASNEQWFWLGDNGGGHALGAGNFPFRVVGNATDTGSFVISSVIIVNTGTGADFDCSDTDIDTLEIDQCSIFGLATFSAPSSGGTSRFCTNTFFSGCGAITHNGASMNGCSFLDSIVGADEGALVYNESTDPDGELDNTTFVKGAAAHHAISFGTNTPDEITLTGVVVSGFNASNQQNDSVLLFPDKGSDTDWIVNIANGTGTFSYKTTRGGDTVTILQSVPLAIGGMTEGARVVIIGDGGAEDGVLLFEGYANASGAVSGSFGGTTPQNVLIKARSWGVILAAIQDDGGAFTDYTLAARTVTGGEGTGSANDVDLTPTTPAANDAFYFGGLDPYGRIIIDIDTAGSGFSGIWEYWDGDSWEALNVTSDPTSGLTVAGWHKVDLDKPSDWDTTTINSQGPYFYSRFRITSVTTPSQARAQSITLGKTVKYLPWPGSGIIASGTGLSTTATWVVSPLGQLE